MMALLLIMYQFVPDWWFCTINYISLCKNIESIQISSLRLKKLIINTCERLVEVKIDAPNLTIFAYAGDLVSFSSSALTLSETDLCFSTPYDIYDSQWYVKYCELLARFHKLSKVLILRTYNSKACLIYQTAS